MVVAVGLVGKVRVEQLCVFLNVEGMFLHMCIYPFGPSHNLIFSSV